MMVGVNGFPRLCCGCKQESEFLFVSQCKFKASLPSWSLGISHPWVSLRRCVCLFVCFQAGRGKCVKELQLDLHEEDNCKPLTGTAESPWSQQGNKWVWTKACFWKLFCLFGSATVTTWAQRLLSWPLFSALRALFCLFLLLAAHWQTAPCPPQMSCEHKVESKVAFLISIFCYVARSWGRRPTGARIRTELDHVSVVLRKVRVNVTHCCAKTITYN